MYFYKIKKTKKTFIILFLILIILFNISTVFASNNTPSITSTAAFLIDNKTNQVLFNKNEEQKMYPASTTKIVTAILTLENCKLDDIVTVSYDTVMSIPNGYSTAYLQVGEELTVEQLLQLLLVHSANDAANALAEYVGGSTESFVAMMNTKANELNLSNTHFTNSFGMHDENHYTTAHDLATIMQYCIKNEDFRRISGSASCAIPATNKYGTRTYMSTNELLLPNNTNYYQYLTAGKTGYTTEAGDCLVSCAYKDNLELVCVILGGSENSSGVSSRFFDTKALYDYAYTNYTIKNIINTGDVLSSVEVTDATQDTKNLDLTAETEISALVENKDLNTNFEPEIVLEDKISAPIEQDQVIGTAKYTINGFEYTSNLLASHNVEKSKLLTYVLEIGSAFVALLLIYEIFFANRKYKRSKRR